MINYILQGSIFITTAFLMFMIIRPTSKGGGQIALLIAGLLLFALNNLQGKLGNSATPYLLGIFIIVFLLLSVLFLIDKKMDSKKSFGVVYFIFMFAAFIVTRGCYFDDKKQQEREKQKQEQTAPSSTNDKDSRN